jgi:hypothetical protein
MTLYEIWNAQPWIYDIHDEQSLQTIELLVSDQRLFPRLVGGPRLCAIV